MKRFIALTVVALLTLGLVGTASAVVTRENLASTKLTGMTVQIRYSDDLSTITEVTISGTAIVFDASGNPAGSYSTRAQWNDLPPLRRAELKTFLEWVSRQVNNAAVAEDVEQTLPDATP